MSDMTDDDQGDDAQELFEFVAGGESCATCKSLDGVVFADEPARPHASCDCDIVPVQTRDGSGKRCGMIDWFVEMGETERYGDGGRYFKINVIVYVLCADGAEWAQDVEVDFGDADDRIEGDEIFDYMDALIFDETSDVAEEIAATNCPACKGEFLCV